jgi:CubicO group peptidase (beta-lactamase class C family)
MRIARVAVAVLSAALLLGPAVAWAQSLRPIVPEQAGFSPQRLGRLEAALRTEIDQKRLPGAVVLIARRGQVAYFETFGSLDPARGTPMPKDAIFRLYSMTKPFTSVAAMMLVEEGRLLLTDPVSKYLAQLAKREVAGEDGALVAAKREITVHDLLRHTSGFTYGTRVKSPVVREAYAREKVDGIELTSAELIDRIARTPLVHHPGAAFEYGRSTDVLGRLVEVITGQSLGAVFEERIFRPLRMTDAGFHVPADRHARIAQAFATDVVTGRPARMLPVTAPPRYEAGGQGAVSTTIDYARFAQMLLNRGELDGARLLARHTVDLMTSDHLGKIRDTFAEPGYGFGLGFAVRLAPGASPSAGSVGDYTWAGAGGTYFWVDPKEQLVVVFMAQTPGPIRTRYRTLVRGLVYQALVD